jgi:four helix bundle protein
MQKEMIDRNPILKLTFEFAIMIMNYCDVLQELKKFTISNQLFRSGTSIGANCFEAQNAESKADFIHKLKIAAKEADETLFWLMLCDYSEELPNCNIHLNKLDEVSKVLNKIISTSKLNIKKIT